MTRKRLLFAVLCMLMLPLFFASYSTRSGNLDPHGFLAFGGHSDLSGLSVWCPCGTPNCTCEPGEQPVSIAVPTTRQHTKSERNTMNTSLAFAEVLLALGLLATRMLL